MSEGSKAAARGIAIFIGLIAVIVISILITSNHDSRTGAITTEPADPSDLQSQLDDATACISDAKSFIDDIQGNIEDAKNYAWSSYDEMGSALDDLDSGSAPSCLDNY